MIKQMDKWYVVIEKGAKAPEVVRAFTANNNLFLVMFQTPHNEDKFGLNNKVNYEVRYYQLSSWVDVNTILSPNVYSPYKGQDSRDWIDWAREVRINLANSIPSSNVDLYNEADYYYN